MIICLFCTESDVSCDMYELLIVSNTLIASPPEHDFLNFIINDLKTYVHQYNDNKGAIIMNTTGPFIIEIMYKHRKIYIYYLLSTSCHCTWII